MLTRIGTRSQMVPATRSTPVFCRVPVPVRHFANSSQVEHVRQVRSVVLMLKAAAEEAEAAEQVTDAITTSVGDAGSSSSNERRKQQQRKPRNNSKSNDSNSDDRIRAIKARRMQVNTLYVQNLAWSTLTDDLQEAFRNCQGYEDAFVKMRKNGRPAGFGFVRFGSEETAAAAAQAMNGVELDGRPIAVRFARPGRTDAADDNSSSSQACQQPGPRTNNSRSADRSNAGESRPVQANTLYVQNLAYSILAEDLQEAFSSCQGYEDANIVVKAGKPAGYGFVRFSSEEAAAAVAEAMDGTELDGRTIKVSFAKGGRTDAAAISSNKIAESAPMRSSSSSSRGGRAVAADNSTEPAPRSSSSSKSSKFEAPAETETRVVVTNLPAGFTYREVLGMCCLFGEVRKVVMYSKEKGKDSSSSSSSSSSNSGAAMSEGAAADEATAEQVEQDAAAVGGDAAADEEDEQSSSNSSGAQEQQQRPRVRGGGAAVALMVTREAAEKVVGELDGRVVQGSVLHADYWKRRASKGEGSKDAEEDASAAA